jgi:hypothetical protein
MLQQRNARDVSSARGVVQRGMVTLLASTEAQRNAERETEGGGVSATRHRKRSAAAGRAGRTRSHNPQPKCMRRSSAIERGGGARRATDHGKQAHAVRAQRTQAQTRRVAQRGAAWRGASHSCLAVARRPERRGAARARGRRRQFRSHDECARTEQQTPPRRHAATPPRMQAAHARSVRGAAAGAARRTQSIVSMSAPCSNSCCTTPK